MSEFPLGYERIHPATWVYLSSLLTIGLFFKFNRLWSLRNLDLVLLVLLSPGLTLVVLGMRAADVEARRVVAAGELAQPQPDESTAGEADTPPDAISADPTAADSAGAKADAQQLREPLERALAMQRFGYVWLFGVGLLFLVRLLADPMLTRRPLLEPNLTTGGLVFIGCSLFIFQMANVVTGRPTNDDLEGPRSGEQLVSGNSVDAGDNSLTRHGPGYAVLFALPSILTTGTSHKGEVPKAITSFRDWTLQSASRPVRAEYLGKGADGKIRLREPDGTIHSVASADLSQEDRAYLSRLAAYTVVAKVMAILAQLAIVVGLVMIGHYHFGNLKMGVGAATLYLLLPYTALMTGRVDHLIPAALMLWAVFFYRQPLMAGIFIGLAAGVVYYPLFLLPLWISFYWQRGLVRFVTGVLSMLAVLALALAFLSQDFSSYLANVQKMFGVWLPVREGLRGIWGLGWDPNFRIPLLAAFVAMSGTFALWPAQKNLGTLLSCSAALMLATQFWHGFGGGLYMAWYVPLALLTIFRPNLEDRVALAVLAEGWLGLRRRQTAAKAGIAA